MKSKQICMFIKTVVTALCDMHLDLYKNIFFDKAFPINIKQKYEILDSSRSSRMH